MRLDTFHHTSRNRTHLLHFLSIPAYNDLNVHRIGFQHGNHVDVVRVKGMMRVNDIDSFQFISIATTQIFTILCIMHAPVSDFSFQLHTHERTEYNRTYMDQSAVEFTSTFTNAVFNIRMTANLYIRRVSVVI